jgi:hypothetical protein
MIDFCTVLEGAAFSGAAVALLEEVDEEVVKYLVMLVCGLLDVGATVFADAAALDR